MGFSQLPIDAEYGNLPFSLHFFMLKISVQETGSHTFREENMKREAILERLEKEECIKMFGSDCL